MGDPNKLWLILCMPWVTGAQGGFKETYNDLLYRNWDNKYLINKKINKNCFSKIVKEYFRFFHKLLILFISSVPVLSYYKNISQFDLTAIKQEEEGRDRLREHAHVIQHQIFFFKKMVVISNCAIGTYSGFFVNWVVAYGDCFYLVRL